MQWLASISVRRPVFASVLILTLVVVGFVGYKSLGVDKYPKIDFPMVTITTIYPGASPSSVETDISDKVEAAVNSIAGVELLTSISTESASLVIAQFVLEKSPDQAAQEVRDKVNAILGQLPDAAELPIIKKADPDAAPVLVLAVRGPGDTREVTRIADTLVRRQVERIADVGQVTLLGGEKRRVNVEVDPIRLRAAGVSALEVARAIGVANVSVPGGKVKEGPVQQTIRIESRAANADDLRRIVVRQSGDHPITVGDVADVLDTTEDADTAALRDGVPTVVLSVTKQSGTNTVSVVDRVKAAIDGIEATLPPGYTIDTVRDNSEQIRTSVGQVIEHLILGSLLAALVVLVFLGSLRSTIIAAVSIPVSVISTFALVSWFGFTLNMMTLLALALAVGIVIDDAIVVLENIFRFIDEKGMKPFPAAILATKEIGLAVLATTMSLMAVFLPVAFMAGIVGRFLMSFGLTMAFAIGVSMLVSFTLTPMMAARMLAPPPPSGEKRRKSIFERITDRFYNPIEHVYIAVLRFVLRRRWVMLIMLVVSCGSLAVTGPKVGFGFLPANDDAQFELYVRTPEGTSIEETSVIAERLARRTRAIPGVTHTVVTVAGSDQKLANVAWVYVRLADPEARAMPQNQIMNKVRKEVLADLPAGTRASAELVNDFSIGTKNAMVSYLITGSDLGRLETYTKQVLEKMKTVPGVVDLDSSMVEPTREAILRPNLERAADLGVDPADITGTIALMLSGSRVSTFEDRGEQYDVMLRAQERYRTDRAAVALLTVPSRTLGHVPLMEVVHIDDGEGPSQITRTSRTRSVTISCNVAPGFSQSDIVAALEKAVADLKMPPGYHSEPFGQSKEAAKMGKAFGFAFLLCRSCSCTWCWRRSSSRGCTRSRSCCRCR
jgi:HAE1 family hydrophobic/amphiphilic exporter-1